MKQYDTVELKDGRTGVIVEVFDDGYMIDVGSSPKDWDTIFVKNDEIKGIDTTSQKMTGGIFVPRKEQS